MKIVPVQAARIPGPPMRPMPQRTIYPAPQPVRTSARPTAPPPPPPPVARVARAVLTAQAIRPHANDETLRRVIRQELRDFRDHRPAPVRDAREGMREQLEDRYPRNQPGNDGYEADPWGDGFGEEGPAQRGASLEPAAGGMAEAQPASQVARLQAAPAQTALMVPDGYGPITQISRNLRIQAAEGHRAGVMRLKNGMYLLVEIAQDALAPEFGVAGVLAPLVINAAATALADPNTQQAISDAASQGIDAVGRGIYQLTHRHQRPPAQHSPRQTQAPRHPSRPAATPMYSSWQPYYPMVPPGYTLVPDPRMQRMMQAQIPGQLSPGGPQRPQLPLRPDALPWADTRDFAGILDIRSDEYSW